MKNIYDNKNITNKKYCQEYFLNIILLLSKCERRILNIYISFANKYYCVYPKQETIAALADCSLKTVNRTVKKLSDLGLIDKWYRQSTSCVYYLNEIFNEKSFRKLLTKIIPSLAFFTIAWLYSGKQQLVDNVTQLSLSNYYNLFINPSVSVSTKREIFSGTETKESHSTKKIVVGGFGGYLKKEIVNMNKLLADKFLGNDDQPSYDNSSKNSQKRESVRTIPAFKTTFPNALVCKAQSLWLLSQQDRMGLDRARRELQERQDQYPEGIANLKAWYSTSEGSAFKEWIEQWP